MAKIQLDIPDDVLAQSIEDNKFDGRPLHQVVEELLREKVRALLSLELGPKRMHKLRREADRLGMRTEEFAEAALARAIAFSEMLTDEELATLRGVVDDPTIKQWDRQDAVSFTLSILDCSRNLRD